MLDLSFAFSPVEVFYERPYSAVVFAIAIIGIIYIIAVKRPYIRERRKRGFYQLSEEEKARRLNEFKENRLPLIKKIDWVPAEIPVIENIEGKIVYLKNDSQPKIDFASFDFLGMRNRKEMKEISSKCIDENTIGSCGPRGFYGTTKVHLDLEDRAAKFFDTPYCLSYSDNASTAYSLIPSLAARGDALFVDECVHESLVDGCMLSRAKIHWFKHNDMEDLRSKLQHMIDNQTDEERLTQRRHIVVEGVYRNTGVICDFPSLVELKNEFSVRLVVDESFSMGTIGATGRGVYEHFEMEKKGLKRTECMDCLCCSMEHSFCSIGGFIAGEREVVEHQRISGGGFCYSASCPPFLSASCQAAIDMLEDEPKLVKNVKGNSELMHEGLETISGLEITGERFACVKHIRLAGASNTEANLRKMKQFAQDNGIMVAFHEQPREEICAQYNTLPPSLRVTICADHDAAMINRFVEVMRSAVAQL